ncbi:DNA adenine methylase [Streptomyces fungicidicus]|uniref:DNA adenine methylase n=1 Tax=Streptomyces fungicidicus TaxID=68203 RepID=UPI0021D58BC9|nr:DNA adenine methylase [Streptomyces fungicidicus]
MSSARASGVSEVWPSAPDLPSHNARLAAIPSAPRSIPGRSTAALEVGCITHPLALGRYQTPLRYPGAKTGLSSLISQLIEAAKKSSQTRNVDLLVEPFAGGASTSLRLVGAGIVNRILLADADPLVAAFWQVAASDTENLVDRMTEEHALYVSKGGATALGRWDFWRSWIPAPGMSESTARFETAMKCLFLNRTTFSGILHGSAGPIGGRRQESKYSIGCRYNVDALAERIRYVGQLYDANRLVDVWCKDWKDTLADVPEWYADLIPDRVLAYLDPPYLEKSQKLYQTSFEVHGYPNAPVADLQWDDNLLHYRLAEYLSHRMQFRWVLSYDAKPELLLDPGLYAANRMEPDRTEREMLGVKRWNISKRVVTLRYTASARQGRGAAEEVLITTLPPSTVPLNDDFRPVDTIIKSEKAASS